MLFLERIASIIFPVLAIAAIGCGYAWVRGDTARTDIAAVNRVSMEVLSPLLVFTALAGKEFSLAHNVPLIVAGILISLGSGALAWPLARRLGYDVRSFVPPMMYNNCGNMGLPLAALAFGSAALPSAVALFAACTLMYFTVGVGIMQSGRPTDAASRYRFLRSPIMLAMVAGVLSSLAHVAWPAPLFQGLKLLGEAAIPVMLFALGVRMRDMNMRSWRIGLAGAIVCPVTGIAIAWLVDRVLPLTSMQRGQMYLFAALPPAVLCFMVAEQYRQEPDRVASIVLLGNVASLLFVPIGLWLGLPA